MTCSFAFAERGAPFANVTCPSTKDLAKEMIESELSGQRFFAAKAECRDYHKFPHFRSSNTSYGENPGSLPWFQADPKSPYEIKKITEDEGNTVEVEFEWHVLDPKNSKKAKKIPDVLKFATYGGKTKDIVGCTGVLFAPANIVVRPTCVNFDKIKK